MPRYADGEPFVPERVFEVGRAGRLLRQWNIPVAAEPLAISGNALLFRLGQGTYSVDSAGVIRSARAIARRRMPVSVQCRVPAALLPSDYAGCWSVADLAAGKRRVLAYEATCT
jgi:hypothetical protein